MTLGPLDINELDDVIRSFVIDVGEIVMTDRDSPYKLAKAICSKFGTPKEKSVKLSKEDILKIMPPPCLSDEFEIGEMWRIDEVVGAIQKIFGTPKEKDNYKKGVKSDKNN